MAKPFVATRQEQSLADLIEQWGAEMGARYEQAELDMIEKVAKYVKAGIDVPVDLGKRMLVLDELRQEGLRIADQLRDPVFVQQVVEVAAREGEAAAVARLGTQTAAGSGITPTAVQATAQIAADLSNRLDVMQSRITRWMPDAYQRVISMVAPNVTLGIDTMQQAQRRAAQAFLARGVTGFTDAGGAQWRIGSYAEMATRTSVNRAWTEANIHALGQSDINLVTIVAAVDCCRFCADAAGKVYSTDGTPGGVLTVADALDPTKTHQVTVTGSLDEARARGWNHPNCRCVVVAYFAGLSIPSGGTHSPEREAARDKLRALERRKRDLKREEAATFDDMTKQRIKGKIRQMDGRIRQHVADTGVTRKPYREQLGFSDGRQGPTPVTGPRPVNPVAPATKPKPKPAPAEPLAPVETPADRKFALARQKISDAKTAAQAGDALEDLGYSAINWTRGTSTETAKEIALTVTNLTEKYPIKLMRNVTIKSISSKGTIARTVTAYKANDWNRQSPLRIDFEISTRYAGAQNRKTMLTDLQHETEIGNFMPHPDAMQMQYAITHEYGHAMASTIPGEHGIPGAEIRDMITKYGRDTSGYGASSYDEMIAEAFADVEFNGVNAKPLSQAMHARVIEGWKANQ